MNNKKLVALTMFMIFICFLANAIKFDRYLTACANAAAGRMFEVVTPGLLTPGQCLVEGEPYQID